MRDDEVIWNPNEDFEDEPVIKIREADFEDAAVVRIRPEDFAGAAIEITDEELPEHDVKALFRSPLLRTFVEFVNSGLPNVFRRTHPDLSERASRREIEETIEQIPDRALRRYLTARLRALESTQSGGR